MNVKNSSRILLTLACTAALASAGTAQAQSGYRGSDNRYDNRYNDNQGGCIGGSRCGGTRSEIRIPLENAGIDRISFRAHDNVGDNSRGHLLVRVDDRILERDIDVPKNGYDYNLDVRGIRGRYLIFEPATDDEVVVEDIYVDYTGRNNGNGNGYGRGGSYGRGNDRDRSGRDDRGNYGRNDDRGNYGRNDDRYGSGWTPYPSAQGCIGGAKCGRQEEIRVRLEDRPIEAIRFRANDDVGEASRGHLRVEIDGRTIEDDIDVAKSGQVYEIDARGLRGRTLVINSFAHDEVEVDGVEVLYQGSGRR
jgi:hypothetical protein